jgi:hypothetical protein
MGKWSSLTPLPGGSRAFAVGFSIENKKGYIGTGYDGSALGSFWKYNPTSDSWVIIDSISGIRAYAVGFSIGEKSYIGTGNNGTDLSDFWVYTQ